MSLPQPPLRRDGPELFADRGDVFMAALPVFEARMEAIDANVIAREAVAVASAAAALISEMEVRDLRVASAWATGTFYTSGALVWSPTDQRTYRRKSSGVSSTDPVLDGAGWSLVTAVLPAILVTSNTHTTVAGEHYVVVTGSSTTLLLPPAPLEGDGVTLTFSNGLYTNVVDRNGETLMGLEENLLVDFGGATVRLRYVNNDWKIV